MKDFYFTQREFDKRCPYAYCIQGYLETLIPCGTPYNLNSARRIDDNTYEATYDIFSSEGSYTLKVKCDVSNKDSYQYSFKRMNG